MTSKEIKAVLDRVLTWDPVRQAQAAEMLLVLEARQGELYHPSDEEWEAILEGNAQIERGESFGQEELDKVWRRHRV